MHQVGHARKSRRQRSSRLSVLEESRGLEKVGELMDGELIITAAACEVVEQRTGDRTGLVQTPAQSQTDSPRSSQARERHTSSHQLGIVVVGREPHIRVPEVQGWRKEHLDAHDPPAHMRA
jgi:hypothetical protein